MTGNELRQRRQSLGLTQDLLAKEFRVSRQSISSWEKQGDESVDHIVSLAMEAICRCPELRSIVRDGIDITEGGPFDAS